MKKGLPLFGRPQFLARSEGSFPGLLLSLCLMISFFVPRAAADPVNSDLDRMEKFLGRCRQAFEEKICFEEILSPQNQAAPELRWQETSFDASQVERQHAVSQELDMFETHGPFETQEAFVQDSSPADLAQRSDAQIRAADEAVMNSLDPGPLDDDQDPPMADFGTARDEEVLRRSDPTADVPRADQRRIGGSRIAFEIAPEISHISYKEPGLMKEKGLMYGLSGALISRLDLTNGADAWAADQRPDPANVIRLEARGSWGEVDYTSEGTGTIDDIRDYNLEFRALAGYDYYPNIQWKLMPYVGFGYRYLNDDSSGRTSSSGAVGYERESNYYYTPLGVEVLFVQSHGWSIGPVLEYDHFWGGQQVSHLGDAVSGLDTVKNDQESGVGYRGSLKFQKTGDRFDILFEPFYRYWDIDQSNTANVTYNGVVVGYGYEPQNTSEEYGFRTAVVF